MKVMDLYKLLHSIFIPIKHFSNDSVNGPYSYSDSDLFHRWKSTICSDMGCARSTKQPLEMTVIAWWLIKIPVHYKYESSQPILVEWHEANF